MRRREVLLIEDDAAFAKLMVHAAADPRVPCNMDMSLTVTGEMGIEFLRQRFARIRSPSSILVLLDLGLPGMGGKATLKAIREDNDLALTPIIILTGSRRSEDMRECYRLGASGFITKPPDDEKIAAGSPDVYAELVTVLSTICVAWQHYTGET